MTTEKQITAALGSKNITSDALATLIVETQSAITQAEQAAERERKKALDLALSPDPAAARKAMEDAAFAADRLKTLLPKLQQRYRAVSAHETYTAWAATFDALKPKHAAAADKLRAVYTAFQDQLVEALTEAKAIDGEVHRVAAAKPYNLAQANGDGRTLPTVEAAARRLPGVHLDFSIMKLKLPVFDTPNQFSWPPHEMPLALQVMGTMVPVASDPRQYTGEWWKVQQERAAAARAQARREQQERQAAADANYHGPRWWERTAS
jgi:hypothetical protein